MSQDMLQLEDRSTLQERVTMSIRKAIFQGYWKDGEKIGQMEVSQMLQVSRMPVREALKQLAQEGLVTFESHKSAVVNPITEKDVIEVYELRSRLESFAVELAVHNLQEQDFLLLEQYHSRMQEAAAEQDMSQYTNINREFHFYIYKKSDWRRLGILITTLWNGLPPHAPSLLPDQVTFSNDDHLKLIHFLRLKDTKQAAELMSNHIHRTGENIRNYILNRQDKSK